MSIFLLLLSAAVTFFGVVLFIDAKNAFHEIEALLVIVTAAVLFAGAFVTNSIEYGRSKILREMRELHRGPKVAADQAARAQQAKALARMGDN